MQILKSILLSTSVIFLGGQSVFCEAWEECAGPKQPILSVADFDGDGVVTNDDVGLVAETYANEEYIAWFDRDADEQITANDIVLTAQDIGKTSTILDQELAVVYWVTERYRDQQVAINEGWFKGIRTFRGHGEHWGYSAEPRGDEFFVLDEPEGLLYSETGELVGIWYYTGNMDAESSYGPQCLPPPEGFTGSQDVWHHHFGTCWNPATTDWTQCLTAQECLEKGSGWYPNDGINMVHAWVHSLNCNGVFGNFNPDVDPIADIEPNHHMCAWGDDPDGSGPKWGLNYSDGNCSMK